MKKIIVSILISLLFVQTILAQSKVLPKVDITGGKKNLEIKSENEGFQIIDGKKNETILLNHTMGNKATNNVRQAMSKIAGLNIWESDGSGIQINISTRGLSPNRSWEFNTRQNGYDICSDVFGYPEAYYNPPLEAVEKIEFIRGSSSLQYGPQFGGLLNYVLKRDKSTKPFNFEGQITTGSYGLASIYTAIGGNTKKWNYYIYNHMRKSDGWRENGYYDIRNSHAYIQYKINSSSNISLEYTNMNYRMQQSGGLTDAMFELNSKQSTRSRNWMGTPWQIANLKYENIVDSNFKFQLSATGLWGERNSIGYLASANKMDTINSSTKDYTNRQLDRDFYRNFGLEWRNILKYKLGGRKQDLAFGLRVYSAHTDRNQKGKGSTGSDFDLTELNGSYTTALDFNTQNISLFAENTFRISDKLSISPGIRYERIHSQMTGRLNTINNIEVNTPHTEINRSIILGGISAQFKLNPAHQIYGSITQAFRPVLFSDLTPPATTDVIDPNLKDANGWNMDLGIRGTWKNLIKYDFSAFYLVYNDRIGTIRQFPNNDPSKSSYQYRTNLGQSLNRGIEGYLEIDITEWLKKDQGFGHLSISTTASYIDATYQDFKVYSVSGNTPNQSIVEKNLQGNKVEYVPTWMLNMGIHYRLQRFSILAQVRTISDVYTDASNTTLPNAEATTGQLNGYTVYDISAEYKLNGHYNIGFGINNVMNERYATRRSGGYPGPGILPSEGRTWYMSFGIKL